MRLKHTKTILIVLIMVIIPVFAIGCSCQPGFKKGAEEEPVEEEYQVAPEFLTPTNQQVESNNQNAVVPTEQIEILEDTTVIIQTAEKFVERFGTYTNKEDFKNIENMKVYMTDSLKVKMDEFISQKKKERKSIYKEPFFGVTTKSVMSKILESTSQEATVLVDTRREEITGKSTKAKIYYQNAIVRLKKIDDDWKMDEISWSS